MENKAGQWGADQSFPALSPIVPLEQGSEWCSLCPFPQSAGPEAVPASHKICACPACQITQAHFSVMARTHIWSQAFALNIREWAAAHLATLVVVSCQRQICQYLPISFSIYGAMEARILKSPRMKATCLRVKAKLYETTEHCFNSGRLLRLTGWP